VGTTAARLDRLPLHRRRPLAWKLCRICGSPIVQARRGRPRLYCSNRCRKAPQSRAVEYANRNAKRRRDRHPLPVLFPDIRNGQALSFWRDELAMDLRQEAELARLEGRDPSAAVREYGIRERSWWAMTCPLFSGD
jgi:hypothetical protein